MDNEEELYLTCQACGSIHTISDAGDLELVEDKLPGNRGVNGIRVHEASGNDWRQRQYYEREPRQYIPPAPMIAGNAGKPVEPNPELIQAHNNDLRKRNIPIDQ